MTTRALTGLHDNKLPKWGLPFPYNRRSCTPSLLLTGLKGPKVSRCSVTGMSKYLMNTLYLSSYYLVPMSIVFTNLQGHSLCLIRRENKRT